MDTESMECEQTPPNSSPVLRPIGEAVRNLINCVCEGEATTKMIVSELERVIQMIDEADR